MDLGIYAISSCEALRRFAQLQPPSENEPAFRSQMQESRDVRSALREMAVALYAHDVEGSRAIAREHGILDLGSGDSPCGRSVG